MRRLKFVSPGAHGILDDATVVIFAVAGACLSGLPSTIAWLTACGHLAFTLVTDAPRGVWAIVPMRIHGWVEFVSGPALVAAPWLFGFSADPAARGFYVGEGLVVAGVWLITDYARPPA